MPSFKATTVTNKGPSTILYQPTHLLNEPLRGLSVNYQSLVLLMSLPAPDS
jgi:hypothetical protein